MISINGRPYEFAGEPRTLLSDFIRAQGLTATKVGCEDGTCGSCTVHLDGEPVRACLLFAIQAEGAQVTTFEALDSPLKQAFHEHAAIQCGFCTAGVLMELAAGGDPKTVVDGHACRCGAQQAMLAAVLPR
jgi:aerobic-type carbon monoxide dehydrogenase small subunit (CoxS/CutS family)